MDQDQRLLMVTVSGRDRPGITAAFTRVMSDYGVEVIEIEQASLRNLLGLYFLLDLGRVQGSSDSVIKDLLFEASRLNLTLNFRLFSPPRTAGQTPPARLVLTIFGDTRALAHLSAILADQEANIQRITTNTHFQVRSVEMVVAAPAGSGLGRLKRRLMAGSRELGVDLALQSLEAYRKNKRLVFFDMDSTLIDMEVIDEMARRAGVAREVARITDRAMRGDFDFEESLLQRVALLKGLRLEELEDIRDHLPLSPGVRRLTAVLRRLGYKLGVVTGGFDFFAQHLKQELGLDYAFANHLEIKDGALTGRLRGEVLDAVQKAHIVNQTACQEGILLDQTVVVGDGANDALMLGQAGLGIAYNARPRLQGVADVSLGKSRLANILHLLGIAEQDVEEDLDC